MNPSLVIALWLLAAYVIGGIPFGFLIGKMRGVDVRTVGSKNIGATNVLRTVGKKWGFLALFCDMMKGFLPTYLCTCATNRPDWLPLVVGIMCAVGHMLTPFMKFKGGKGVATGAGMLFGLIPGLMGLALLVFIFFFACSNMIALGSCLAAAFIGVTVWIPMLGYPGYHDIPQAILVTFIAAFIVFKHRANIVRIKNGCENKVYIFKKQPKPADAS